MKSESFGPFRIGLLDTLRDSVNLLLNLRRRYSGPHLPKHIEEVIAAACQHFLGGLQRQPNTLLDVRTERIRKMESCRQDADNGAFDPANPDRMSDNAGIGIKALPPQALREERHLWSPRIPFCRCKGPAD